MDGLERPCVRMHAEDGAVVAMQRSLGGAAPESAVGAGHNRRVGRVAWQAAQCAAQGAAKAEAADLALGRHLINRAVTDAGVWRIKIPKGSAGAAGGVEAAVRMKVERRPTGSGGPHFKTHQGFDRRISQRRIQQQRNGNSRKKTEMHHGDAALT